MRRRDLTRLAATIPALTLTAAALAKSDGSRQGIRDALENLHDLPALNGPVSYSPTDHTGQDSRSIAVARLNNGVMGPAV